MILNPVTGLVTPEPGVPRDPNPAPGSITLAGGDAQTQLDSKVPEDQRSFLHLIDNFIMVGGGSNLIGQLGWRTVFTGGGVGAASVGDANHPFGVLFNTGSSATGAVIMALSIASTAYASMFAGGGEIVNGWTFNLSNLSTVGEEYKFRVGLMTRVSDTDNTEAAAGIYFLYDRLVNGANWQLVTGKGGVRTTVDSGVPVQAAAFTMLRSITNADGSQVTFQIATAGGVLTTIGTISTNIPNTSANKFTPILQIVKTAGTTQRNVEVFYFRLRQSFTTPR